MPVIVCYLGVYQCILKIMCDNYKIALCFVMTVYSVARIQEKRYDAQYE